VLTLRIRITPLQSWSRSARPTDPPRLSSRNCRSASKTDPCSASNLGPFERRVLTVALAPLELVGVAETGRARVV